MSAAYNLLSSCSTGEDCDVLSNSCGCDERDSNYDNSQHEEAVQTLQDGGFNYDDGCDNSNALMQSYSDLTFRQTVYADNYQPINDFQRKLSEDCRSSLPVNGTDILDNATRTRKPSSTFSIIENPVLSIDSMQNKKSSLKTSTLVTSLDVSSSDKLQTTLTSLVVNNSSDDFINDSVSEGQPILLASQKLIDAAKDSNNYNESQKPLEKIKMSTANSKWAKPPFNSKANSLGSQTNLNNSLRPKSFHKTRSSAFQSLLSDGDDNADKSKVQRASSLTMNTTNSSSSKKTERQSDWDSKRSISVDNSSEITDSDPTPNCYTNNPGTAELEEPNIQSNLLANFDNTSDYVFKSGLSKQPCPYEFSRSDINENISYGSGKGLFHGVNNQKSLQQTSTSRASCSTPCIADINGQTSFKVPSTSSSSEKFTRSNSSRAFASSKKNSSSTKSKKSSSSCDSNFTSLTRSKSLSGSSISASVFKRKGSESSACLDKAPLTSSERDAVTAKTEETSQRLSSFLSRSIFSWRSKSSTSEENAVSPGSMSKQQTSTPIAAKNMKPSCSINTTTRDTSPNAKAFQPSTTNDKSNNKNLNNITDKTASFNLNANTKKTIHNNYDSGTSSSNINSSSSCSSTSSSSNSSGYSCSSSSSFSSSSSKVVDTIIEQHHEFAPPSPSTSSTSSLSLLRSSNTNGGGGGISNSFSSCKNVPPVSASAAVVTSNAATTSEETSSNATSSWWFFGKGSQKKKNDKSKVSRVGEAGSVGLIMESRPGNLPAKSQHECQQHRQQYQVLLEYNKRKEQQQQQHLQQQLQSRLRQEAETAHNVAVWTEDVIPQWSSKRDSKKCRELWWKGVPSCVRGKVWQLAIGNQLNVSPHLYHMLKKRAEEEKCSPSTSEISCSSQQQQRTPCSCSGCCSTNCNTTKQPPTQAITKLQSPTSSILNTTAAATSSASTTTVNTTISGSTGCYDSNPTPTLLPTRTFPGSAVPQCSNSSSQFYTKEQGSTMQLDYREKAGWERCSSMCNCSGKANTQIIPAEKCCDNNHKQPYDATAKQSFTSPSTCEINDGSSTCNNKTNYHYNDDSSYYASGGNNSNNNNNNSSSNPYHNLASHGNPYSNSSSSVAPRDAVSYRSSTSAEVVTPHDSNYQGNNVVTATSASSRLAHHNNCSYEQQQTESLRASYREASNDTEDSGFSNESSCGGISGSDSCGSGHIYINSGSNFRDGSNVYMNSGSSPSVTSGGSSSSAASSVAAVAVASSNAGGEMQLNSPSANVKSVNSVTVASGVTATGSAASRCSPWSSWQEVAESSDCISLDVSRTFPHLCIFQEGGPFHGPLRSILSSYVRCRPDVGYVQGMSFLAATVLLNMPENDAFVAFANLLNRPLLQAFYSLHHKKMSAYYRTYSTLLTAVLPALSVHLRRLDVTPDLYLLDWVLSLFTHCLPLDVASRLWDIYFRDGDEFLFRAAYGILKLYERELLSQECTTTAAQFLTRLPTNTSEQQLFAAINKISMPAGRRGFAAILSRHELEAKQTSCV
uniref:TBC1 domain family member 14 n=1 Tax=Hirondellea gigas TaxID=1518452 RepID=A0A6A7G0G3_9CRUS